MVTRVMHLPEAVNTAEFQEGSYARTPIGDLLPVYLDNPGQAAAPTVGSLTGILTDPQFKLAVQALEQRDGVDLLTAPEVTTESGRQAQIQTVDLQTIVTGNNASGNTGGGATGGTGTTIA